ncbi:MAG: LysM peptidoglycan-binding domain-containing protein [Ktedonobacteraceae bacterium]
MPDVTRVAKAELRELDANFDQEINPDKWVKVQFNPETLKVAFTNTVKGDQKGSQGLQYVGEGSTGLSLQLWFDLTVPLFDSDPQVSDVREYTKKVLYYITPAGQEGASTNIRPPAVRFLWGSFQYDGVMESLTESLEFFSSEGIPLRASIDLKLTQQKIQQINIRNTGSIGGMFSAGTSPLTLVKAGSTIQGIADSMGGNWQSIAAANGIQNPRLPQPGQLIKVFKKFF